MISRNKQQTVFVVLAWLWIAAIWAASLMPSPPDLGIEQGDKIEHLSAYLIAMLLCALGYRIKLVRFFVGLITMGIAVEFAQSLTSYRTFDVLDMLANSLGVGLGWLAWQALARLLPRLSLNQK